MHGNERTPPGGTFSKMVMILVLVATSIALDIKYLTLLWEWFAVPLGAPLATWRQLVGLRVLVSVMARTVLPSQEGKASEDPIGELLGAVLFRAIVMLFVWLVLT